MPHDESQPLPTIRPNNPPPTEPPDTDRGDTSHSSAVPQVRVGVPLAPPGFELGDELGRGGMGVVFAARDVEVGREVAVKLLRPEYVGHESSARRFVEEAQITGQLQHPGIPAVYRVGTMPDGSPFLAMKLVKGRTLADLLRDRASPAADRGRFVAIFEGICQAVGYAHAHGVIHRDLKPHNVMVGAFGEVQVMDWGLAKVLTSGGVHPRRSDTDTEPFTRIRASRGADDATSAGSILGTPAFMPPEQAIGAVDKIDRQSDVFGLGGVLCAIITGKPPYIGETSESTRQLAAQAKLSDAFARLDATDADPDLVALCKRCLTGEKVVRPADAGAVAGEVACLRAAADERARQAELDRERAAVREVEERKRRRVLVTAASLVAGALSVGLGVSIWQATEANSARRDADIKREEAKSAQAVAVSEKNEADAARGEEATQRKAAEAILKFFEENVFAAGRPKGQNGGLDSGVSLQKALVASLRALDIGFRDQPLVEARLRDTLGTTFSLLGDDLRALEQTEQARALYLTHRGPDHPSALGTSHNLALRYDALGRHKDALKLHEETLAAQKRILPPDHPDTLTSMSSLANTYTALGRYPDALKLRQESLAIRQRVLPPDHPNILTSMDSLAKSYAVLDRHQEALEMFEKTVAGMKRALPPNHPDTLISMNNLALSYAALDRHADAVKLFEETLAVQKRVLPADHPSTLRSMNNLAITYAALGRRTDAVGLREETLAAFKRVLPADHPNTLRCMNNLALSYSDLGRHADALKLNEQALAAFKRALPPHHPDTLTVMGSLASSLIRLNRGAEAIPLIDECVANAVGKGTHPHLIPSVLDLRLQHFEKAGDPGGCQTTAGMWEKLNRTDPVSLYNAAHIRAVTARVTRENDSSPGAELRAEEQSDLAMRWLQMAVAAGFTELGQLKNDGKLSVLHRRADFWLLVAKLEGKTFEPAPPPRAGK